MRKKDNVTPLSSANQIDLNGPGVIDKNSLSDTSDIKAPIEDTLDLFIKQFTPPVIEKYSKNKGVLLLDRDIVHMIVREFCLNSNLFLANHTWNIKLILSHVSDEKTFIPDKKEIFLLPPIMSDRRYTRGDFVSLGPKFDQIGGKQAGPTCIAKMEHPLYMDGPGILWLAKTFVKDTNGYDEYYKNLFDRSFTEKEISDSIEAEGRKNNGAEVK